MTLLEASVFARTRVRLDNPLSDVRLQRLLCRPDLLDVGWVGRIFKHQVQMVRAHRQKQGDDAAWERDVGQHATRAPRVELLLDPSWARRSGMSRLYFAPNPKKVSTRERHPNPIKNRRKPSRNFLVLRIFIKPKVLDSKLLI